MRRDDSELWPEHEPAGELAETFRQAEAGAGRCEVIVLEPDTLSEVKQERCAAVRKAGRIPLVVVLVRPPRYLDRPTLERD